MFLICRERGLRVSDVARESYALFSYVAREDYVFFDVSRKMDPRALSGKFLRVKSRYPESFRFLGL